mmetsp:Transcript_22462/g.56466  ORF Transcript_22462/g.56466 Transcript_22462/m.56466 type:complete len:367 (-) Transcript_22462:88-1188(-)
MRPQEKRGAGGLLCCVPASGLASISDVHLILSAQGAQVGVLLVVRPLQHGGHRAEVALVLVFKVLTDPLPPAQHPCLGALPGTVHSLFAIDEGLRVFAQLLDRLHMALLFRVVVWRLDDDGEAVRQKLEDLHDEDERVHRRHALLVVKIVVVAALALCGHSARVALPPALKAIHVNLVAHLRGHDEREEAAGGLTDVVLAVADHLLAASTRIPLVRRTLDLAAAVGVARPALGQPHPQLVDLVQEAGRQHQRLGVRHVLQHALQQVVVQVPVVRLEEDRRLRGRALVRVQASLPRHLVRMRPVEQVECCLAPDVLLKPGRGRVVQPEHRIVLIDVRAKLRLQQRAAVAHDGARREGPAGVVVGQRG